MFASSQRAAEESALLLTVLFFPFCHDVAQDKLRDSSPQVGHVRHIIQENASPSEVTRKSRKQELEI